MPKFSVNATELSNTDVNFVALVKRGANRIPFRITKSEDNDMIDLHAIGARLFKGDAQPSIVAIYVAKGADMPKVSAALKSAGIELDAFLKGDMEGGITLVKSDVDTNGVALFKMAGGVTMAISHVAKSFDAHDFQSPDFKDVHAKGTHMQAMAQAGDSLHRTMGNIMDNASDPKDAAKQICAACDAHKDHVAKLTRALPMQAFKADVELHKAFASGGADDDQTIGDGLGDKANGAARAVKASSLGANLSEEGDPSAKDPLMPAANPGQTRTVSAEKGDAGKNGTGAGAELGQGTGTDDRSTEDDKNQAIDANAGERVSGDNSGMPDKAMASTKKAELRLAKAHMKLAKAQLALAKLGKFDGDGDEDDAMIDDDSTNGAQSDLPPGTKAPTALGGVNKSAQTTDVTTIAVTGESAAGDGAAQDPIKDTGNNATDDDNKNAGGNVTGKVKGKTLDMDGVPARAKAPTVKNDGDADVGKKGKGEQLDDQTSGAGAQEATAQTLKSQAALMKALQAMSKSVSESIAAVTKSVETLNTRVDQVASMAQKTDAALNGTVFADAGGDNVRVEKSAGTGAPPLLDTAYSRRGAA